MENFLVPLDSEQAKTVRRMAKEQFGGRKGSLKAVFWAGVQKLDEGVKRQRLLAEAIATLHEGHDSGLKPGERFYKERGELYDR